MESLSSQLREKSDEPSVYNKKVDSKRPSGRWSSGECQGDRDYLRKRAANANLLGHTFANVCIFKKPDRPSRDDRQEEARLSEWGDVDAFNILPRE